MRRRKITFSTVLALLFLGQFAWTSYVGAGTSDSVPAPAVHLTEAGVEVEWAQPTARRGVETRAWQSWPDVEINGIERPAYLLPFLLADAEAEIEITHLRTQKWAQDSRFQRVELPERSLPNGEVLEALPRAPATEAPDQPVVLLRQGMMRGERIGVVAIMPLYAQGDEIREVVELRFAIKDAHPLGEKSADLLAQTWNQPWRLSADVPAPSPVTGRTALQITVEKPGIQEISLAQIMDLGLIKATAEIERLHLYYGQDPVALEVTPDRELLRFYAPPHRDRWNQAGIYWLTFEQNPGLRMSRQAALSENTTPADTQTWAWEEGEWYKPIHYESRHPGPDGDFWFMANLRAGAEIPTTAITLPLPIGLPPLDSSGVFTLTGTAYLSANHALQIRPYSLSAPASPQDPLTLTWEAQRDWSQSASMPGNIHTIVASLQATGRANALWIDRLTWRRPVSLAFAGRGGYFKTSGDLTRYQLSGLPKSFQLYDVTDPRRPILVEITGQESKALVDSSGERHYLLAPISQWQIHLPIISSEVAGQPPNGDTPVLHYIDRAHLRHRPQIAAHTPYNWQPALDADVLYVAPNEFIQGLAPLIEHRRRQGYQPAVVDVQAIYNGWSGGHVSPDAIRTFLQYAAAQGRQSPVAVILVGDGTSDPLNYTGRNNINFIPPYLSMVDPWLGETACDTCYAKLDGDDPRLDPLPDLLIGRIPAKSAGEVDRYLEKLLDYETKGPSPRAASQIVYIADNAREADGTPDRAGDFALSAEKSIALQPAGMEVKRIYYDPSPTHVEAPWRIQDALDAYQQTVAAMDAGAGFVNYIGHAHHWQWAHTDFDADPSHLFGLFDVDTLTNRQDLSVVLSLTCLTAAFQTPAFSGTTLDERLIMHENGGAVAVWGPTGFGVAYGHDLLQDGFYKQYWSGNEEQRIGALAQAGYVELFTKGICCQDTINTYVVLGDPLMVPQVWADQHIYLPWVTGP